MRATFVVASKEFRELRRNRSALLASAGVVFFFTAINASSISSGNVRESLNRFLFLSDMMAGLFIAYVFAGQVFFKEKRDRVIETVMCSPLSLRQIWLGKVLGITALGYLISLLTAILITMLSGLLSQTVLVPSPPLFVHVLLVIPGLCTAFTGLLGFGQLLLGMLENRILAFLTFMPLFGAMYSARYVLGDNFRVTWIHVEVLFAAALFLLIITAFLVRLLSKERIVTTIP